MDIFRTIVKFPESDFKINYNSKMLFQIIYMISNDKWPYGKNILLINTGGIQSIDEINLRLKKKGCVTINH